jgi:hypothetical protein
MQNNFYGKSTAAKMGEGRGLDDEKKVEEKNCFKAAQQQMGDNTLSS